MEGIGIIVDAISYTGQEVSGVLTGNGSGKYTGVIYDGRTVAVFKSSVKLQEAVDVR